ncbi:Integrin alpha-X [Tupaia chinensis]|uniref:Integrin alpha-X n=1 Tax=Tupaia chinensis TaxID=246437 RepID=L9KU25_TUPCH|nr:Integrin alpha-X [Tupaia chinensis]
MPSPGTETKSGSSFEWEMAQEGFSAVFTPDGPVLGAVGSFSWSGGAFLYQPNKNPTFLNMSEERVDMRDSYLGYSTELALWKGEQNLVLGAPRYQHTGKVVIFTPGPKQWRLKAEVTGTQTGSYFGASLCSMDVNRDGNTDLVLIGAPHFYEQTQGGRVSVCPLPKVRVAGSQLSPRLQYFGQSLSGGQDLTEDGLVDLAVGAQGHALLLRTRPVLQVWMSIRFTPPEIPRSVYECQEQVAPVRTLGDATVCLHIYKSSKNRLSDLQSSVTFDLALDPGRPSSRAVFKETNTRTLSRARDLGLTQYCEAVPLLLPACVEDSMTPIIMRLNFSLEGKQIPSFGKLRPMLDVNSQRYLTASLPFEKNCGDDRVCQDDLSISFDFSGLNTLLVGSNLELNVAVALRNDGEDSYRTTVTFSYPAGLSYRRVTEGQNQLQLHSPRLTCDSVPAGSQDTWTTSCSSNHLIFRGGAQITFLATFDVSPRAVLGDRLLLTANVSSDNNTPRTSKTTFQLELPVKYTVYTVISSHEQSTKYLNFSASEKQQSSVNNLGQRDLPVSIYFWVPMELHQEPVWMQVEVSCPQNPSMQCSSERIAPPESDFLNHIQKNAVLDCSIAACLRLRCDIPSFGVQEELDFVLKGNLSFGWVSQTLQKKVSLVSVAEITFDRSVYAQLPGQEAFLRAQVNNLGQRDLPVSIYFWVPMELHQEPVWTQVEVSCPQNPSMQCSSERIAPPESDFLNHIQKNAVLDCSIAACLRLRCDIPSFGVQEELDFVLKGNLSFGWVSQTLQKKVSLVSVAEITFDRSVYAQLPGQEAFLRAQVGFFKRQYKEMMQEENQQIVPGNEASDPRAAQ